jgi:hypothetical protein
MRRGPVMPSTAPAMTSRRSTRAASTIGRRASSLNEAARRWRPSTSSPSVSNARRARSRSVSGKSGVILRSRWRENVTGVKAFFISWATRRATSCHALSRSALARSRRERESSALMALKV